MQSGKADPWKYEKSYLEETQDKENNVDKWLLMIANKESTELKGKEDEKILDFHGYKLKAVKRSKKPNGGFSASVPEDRMFANYLSHGDSQLVADKNTDLPNYFKEYNGTTAVALIYIANFDPIETNHSVWFSLHFPGNALEKNPVWTHRDISEDSGPSFIT